MNEEYDIIVTGGAGFIGSHLCEELGAMDCSVLVIDNFTTGNIKNLEEAQKKYPIDVNPSDIISAYDIECDVIFNLACPASPVKYQINPITTMLTNVVGTFNALQVANRYGSTIVQASTSEIYGDPDQHPQKEDYWGNVNPVGPRSCYDEGKRAAESMCVDFHRIHDVDVRIARIFNTYGPRMALDDGRVVSNFIRAALLGKPLTVYGDGMQTRSLCYVTDTVEALIALGDVALEGSMPIVNIGNPQEITMYELAEKVIKKTKSSSRIVFEKLPIDDPRRRKPDITEAKQTLLWEPKVSLDDGLDMTIEYFRKELSCLQ